MLRVLFVIAAMLLPAAQCPAASAPPGQTVGNVVTLSADQRQVSQIAAQNGDQDYLLVDKHYGKVILFRDGNPVFIAAALSGQSRTDRLPPGSLSKKFSQLKALADKVTPAGRFTVSRDVDKDYGPVLDINEIQGRDWAIAIHQLYLGTKAERREYRLQSADHLDRHITHGCINVAKSTMRYLLDNLPQTGRPALYVMPHNASKIAEFFPRRN